MGCCCSKQQDQDVPMIQDQLIPNLNPVITHVVERISSDSGETPLFPPATEEDDNQVVSDVEILSEHSDGAEKTNESKK